MTFFKSRRLSTRQSRRSREQRRSSFRNRESGMPKRKHRTRRPLRKLTLTSRASARVRRESSRHPSHERADEAERGKMMLKEPACHF